MELAAQIGVDINDFWYMTPFELSVYAKGYGKRLEAENEIITKNNMVQAYLISRWVWRKKVNIEKYLETSEKKIMSDEEMLNTVKALNAVFGGSIKQKRLQES